MTIKITIEFYISSRFPLRILGQATVGAEIGHGYVVNPQLHSDIVKGGLALHLFKFIFAGPKTCQNRQN